MAIPTPSADQTCPEQRPIDVDLAPAPPDGDLYVVEFDEASWASVEIFGEVTGGTVNRCDLGTMSCEEVTTGEPMPTAITFGKDGTLWLARNALAFGNNEVVPIG